MKIAFIGGNMVIYLYNEHKKRINPAIKLIIWVIMTILCLIAWGFLINWTITPMKWEDHLYAMHHQHLPGIGEFDQFKDKNP